MQGQGGPPQGQRPHASPPAGSTSPAGSDEIIYEGIAKHSAIFGSYLKWSLVCVVGGVGGGFLLRVEALAAFPMYLLSLVGLPFLIWTFLKHTTTRFKVSIRRVEFERGVIAKNVDSLELWRVLDVRFEQSLIDRMFGNAKIILIGTDQTHPEFPLHGLPDPRRVFERLREAVQAARHTSRPMELVGQDGIEGFESV